MHLLFQRARIHLFLALSMGLILRLWWIHTYPLVDGDSFVYGDIAKLWLHTGIYGFTDLNRVRPTLIRLPGYPVFLAVCFRLFGMEHYDAVLYTQAAFDLATCVFVAAFAARYISLRAGKIAIYLAALCPFTANYVAAPLTETLSIFCVALGLYALARYVERPGLHRWFFLLAFAVSYAALLRPDGALLGLVLLSAMFWSTRKRVAPVRAAKLALLCAALTLLPFLAWTLRNARTFHVFQPLAPRYANDPGEFAYPGWNHWVKTWCVEFTSTFEVYWNAGSAPLALSDLPARAMETPAEFEQTAALYRVYNTTEILTPQLDAQFGLLAAERRARRPLRFFIVLPALRLADMWLRPRIEMFDMELRWWQYSHHKSQTIFAWSYAALNLAYLLLALCGIFCRNGLLRVPYVGWMIAYVALRCLLLLTLEAPEPRYTLECFPMIIILAAAALTVRGGLPKTTYSPSSSSTTS